MLFCLYLLFYLIKWPLYIIFFSTYLILSSLFSKAFSVSPFLLCFPAISLLCWLLYIDRINNHHRILAAGSRWFWKEINITFFHIELFLKQNFDAHKYLIPKCLKSKRFYYYFISFYKKIKLSETIISNEKLRLKSQITLKDFIIR